MARVTRAVRRAACLAPRVAACVAAGVLAVIAAVLGFPSAAQASSVASPASHQVRTGLFAPSGTTRSAANTAQQRARVVDPGEPAAIPGGPGVSVTPATAPQGAICSGLTIVGLGGLCEAGSAVVGSLNDLCSPGPPSPEPAGGGIDAMIRPPQTGAANAPKKLTLYQSYGMAGQSWAPYNLKCSDMTSMIGNSVANTVFDGAKAIDRITITTYQSAAGEGLLGWLKQRVDQLISQIGHAVYFPYLAPVVLLGAIWMAWQGLIRKRATRTIEGTIWMVVACVAAIWLIGRPADFTGVGQKVSDGISQVLNAAFSRLPVAGGTDCVPVGQGDPQSTGENYAYTSGNEVVNQNADELWAVLVCKPWLAGEFGTMSATGNAGNVVHQYGRALLWSQAFAVNERPTLQLATQKQNVYQGIAKKLEQDPAVYPVFQGKQWATRLEIAFAGLFAALVAGALVLLIAITLIVLKLGFLLLLVAGPFFLILGTHPGFGRVIAIRWFEMLVGVLMKQGAVALTLSVLLYCYALVMGASDNALPWVFKIMMIALLTVAVFIYRRPFQHLFTSVGYDMLGARERAEAYREQARYGFRGQTERAATATIPGYSAYRVARWARRNPDQADQAAFIAQSLAGAAATGGVGAAVAAGLAGRRSGKGPPNGQGPPDFAEGDGGPDPAGPSSGGSRPGGAGVRPDLSGEGGNGRREPPPLDLPRRPRGSLPRWQPGPRPPRREGVPPLTLSGSAAAPQAPAKHRPAQSPQAQSRRAQSQRAQSPQSPQAQPWQAQVQPRPAPASSTGSVSPGSASRPTARPSAPASRGASERKLFNRSWVRPIRRDR